MTNDLHIRKFHGIVTTADGSKYSADYWVGMELPEDRDPEDFTMVEVTAKFRTKKALLAAIEGGYATKEG